MNLYMRPTYIEKLHSEMCLLWAGTYEERQEKQEKKQKLDDMMKKIQNKFGEGAIKRGEEGEHRGNKGGTQRPAPVFTFLPF